MTINEAIESLEYKKHVISLTNPSLWTESEEMALDALKMLSNDYLIYIDEIRVALRYVYED